jgi:N-glycosylase/DNA lyase
VKEFRSFNKKSNNALFKELCFCILTANFTAERGINIQNKIGNGFLTLTEKQLAKKLKKLGHRFPNTRAKYIVEARKHKNNLSKLIKTKSEYELREWLAENVKGLGYKEASHFLRNIGFNNVAIADFHIVDVLAGNNLIEKPKAMTKKKYLEAEEMLKKIASRCNLCLSELDLYLWYIETGKVLK